MDICGVYHVNLFLMLLPSFMNISTVSLTLLRFYFFFYLFLLGIPSAMWPHTRYFDREGVGGIQTHDLPIMTSPLHQLDHPIGGTLCSIFVFTKLIDAMPGNLIFSALSIQHGFVVLRFHQFCN